MTPPTAPAHSALSWADEAGSTHQGQAQRAASSRAKQKQEGQRAACASVRQWSNGGRGAGVGGDRLVGGGRGDWRECTRSTPRNCLFREASVRRLRL